jgi:hypothetical protein
MTEKKHYQSEYLISLHEIDYRTTSMNEDYFTYIEKRFVIDTLNNLDIEVLKKLINFKYTNPKTMIVINEEQHYERENLFDKYCVKFSADFFM